MRKFLYAIVLLIFSASLGYSQVTTLWENSAAAGTLPSWFDITHLTRALAYGNNHVYIVSRNGGNFTFVYDAATGDSVGLLDATGIAGGTYAVSDVEVSADGKIFVCNLAVGGTFTVYKYDTEGSSPLAVINYDATGKRLGDKFTVTGSTADNSIVIWAASANSNDLVKFTTTDNGASFTPQVINVGITGGSASVGPLSNADFYYNATGINPRKYQADGTLIGSISGTIVATGSNAIRYVSIPGTNEYFATFAYGAGNENARIVKVPGGNLVDAELFGVTPSLGTNANGNGAGDVSLQKVNDYIYNIYVLSCNNGFGAYQLDFRTQLAGDYYIPQGANPQGFATLNDAVAELNAGVVTGPVNFILDADTVRANSFTLNADLSADNNLVIKPATGRDVTLIINNASASVGNGPFLIGINKGHVTFDGSNDGTDSRNLVITTEQISPVVDLPITLNNANADFVVLKNLVIKNIFEGQTNFRYGAVINDLGGVEAFQVENCQIGTAERPVRRDALAPWGGGAVANQFSFINNEMFCGTRGVATIYLYDSEIIGNTINILPTTAAATDAYNHGIYITGHTGTLDILGNTINCLEKTINVSSYLIGIAFAGNGSAETDIINVVNNFVNVGAEDETRYTYGIGLRSAQNMGNLKVYHNTIVINDNASSLVSHAIGNHTNGTGPVNMDLKNNIIINKHTGNTGSSALALIPATSVLTSDYNVLLSAQNLVNYQGILYADLAAWQATNQDLNSVSKPVNFVSDADLHLTGASLGDFDLAGMPIPGITTDIDGDTRSTTYPYKGADEGNVPLLPPLPDVLLVENFEYGAVDDTSLVTLTSDWVRHSGAMGPAYSATSLFYSGYPSSGIGGAVTFTNGGSGNNDGDIHRIFTKVTQTQDVYASFLLNLSSALPTADYFFHLGPDPIATTFRGRVFVRSNGSGFSFGLSKSSDTRTDDNTILNFNQTYLVVLKYSFNTDATNDDVVTLYVYESGLPAIEPGSPLVTIGPVGAGTTSDPVSIGAVAIRQGTNTATGKIDGIRVTTTWAEVVIPVELSSFVATTNGNSVMLNWSTATETNNQGFEVERRSDGEFVKVGFVPGFGTTTETKQYSFTDNNLPVGTYSYRLKQVDFDGTFEYSKVVEVEVLAPQVFDLAQNYPNPFNPNTVIEYSIASPVNVTLTIYSVLGEQVAVLVNNQFTEAGKYTVQFNAANLASGTYIYRLQAGDFVSTKKMLLMK